MTISLGSGSRIGQTSWDWSAEAISVYQRGPWGPDLEMRPKRILVAAALGASHSFIRGRP